MLTALEPWILLGPTACGKSSLALELATRLDLEIVSMDSMQIYQGLPLLTQAIPPAEQRGIPHHLLEFVDPRESFDTGRYLASARECLARIARNGRRALFVGGTALYYRALVDGLSPLPAADPVRREELQTLARTLGPHELWNRLHALDPDRARDLDPRDERRLVRALEIATLTGEAPTALYQKPRPVLLPEFRAVGLRRDREELDRRIADRVEAMWAGGLVGEVAAFRERYGEPKGTSLQALGLGLVLDHLDGRLTGAETRELLVRGTRQFARKQGRAFKADPRISWVAMTDRGESDVLVEIEAHLVTQSRPARELSVET